MAPILPGAPWLIAHRAMLEVNQPQKITLNETDYVLWQNAKKEVFALENVCPHLQAPLSNGWICAERNTITCPFHALEFDGKGRLYRQDKSETASLLSPLPLTVVGDWIWSYGNDEPRLAIPDIVPSLTEEFYFLGVCAERSIQSDFLTCLKINYDFNHVLGTHRDLLKFDTLKVRDYQINGYWTKVTQEVSLKQNNFSEIVKDPTLLISPKKYINEFLYNFPSITCIKTLITSFELIQFVVLYPESENRTKTFALLYIKLKNKWLLPLIKKKLLASFHTIIEQDAQILESLYPAKIAKIRLPDEEIMYDAEKLYQEW